jgi:hypothetical protein
MAAAIIFWRKAKGYAFVDKSLLFSRTAICGISSRMLELRERTFLAAFLLRSLSDFPENIKEWREYRKLIGQ